jgi:hypothetical protein
MNETRLRWFIQKINRKGNIMANTKQTSKSVASKASKALRDGRSSARTKSIAASALSQTKSSRRK